MGKIRGTGAKPEKLLRKAVWNNEPYVPIGVRTAATITTSFISCFQEPQVRINEGYNMNIIIGKCYFVLSELVLTSDKNLIFQIGVASDYVIVVVNLLIDETGLPVCQHNIPFYVVEQCLCAAIKIIFLTLHPPGPHRVPVYVFQLLPKEFLACYTYCVVVMAPYLVFAVSFVLGSIPLKTVQQPFAPAFRLIIVRKG